MNQPAEVAPNAVAGLVFFLFLALGASMLVCSQVIERWRRGRPAIPYQPRRPVPWRFPDVLIVLLVFLISMEFAGWAVVATIPPEARQAAAAQDLDRSTTLHPVAQLAASGNLWMALLAVSMAVLVAPVAEEILFRLLLQGWLESVQQRHFRARPDRLRTERPPFAATAADTPQPPAPSPRPGDDADNPFAPPQSAPLASPYSSNLLRSLRRFRLAPAVIVSLVFAMMHFRKGTLPKSQEYLVALMTAQLVQSVLTTLCALAVLRFRAGATAVDLGWSPQHFWPDVRLGLIAFAGLAAPLYLLQFGLNYLLPSYLAPDPITIFLFTLVLGTLYHRTHRLVPSVTLHMALNGTSMLMLLAATK